MIEPHADPGTTSLSLLARWLSNDTAAWERVTHLYYPLVYRWCRRRNLQPEDASDVAQEVFRVLARKPERFQSDHGKNSFRGWLWGVTRNELKMFWRKESNQPQASGGTNAQQKMQELTRSETDWDNLSEPLEPSDTNDVIHRAMELMQSEFEQSTWLAFWKTTVDGQVAKDVAEELQLTVNAVYLARSRVLKRLRSEFQELVEL